MSKTLEKFEYFQMQQLLLHNKKMYYALLGRAGGSIFHKKVIKSIVDIFKKESIIRPIQRAEIIEYFQDNSVLKADRVNQIVESMVIKELLIYNNQGHIEIGPKIREFIKEFYKNSTY